MDKCNRISWFAQRAVWHVTRGVMSAAKHISPCIITFGHCLWPRFAWQGTWNGIPLPFQIPAKYLYGFKLNEHPERMGRLLVTVRAGILSSFSATMCVTNKASSRRGGSSSPVYVHKGQNRSYFFVSLLDFSHNRVHYLFALCMHHVWALWCMLVKSSKSETQICSLLSNGLSWWLWYYRRLANFPKL